MFCKFCDTLIFYPVDVEKPIICRRCENEYNDIEFPVVTEKKTFQKKTRKEEEKFTAAVIKETCPKCGNDEMSYTTAQLRSADEGQTVFYKCTACSYKYTVNS